MTRWLALASLAALAACGSGGRDPIVQAAIEEFGGFWAREDRVPETPPRAVTRADIERADVAAIQAKLASDETPTLMYAAASNGGYVTYVSALQQQIILRGAQVAGTRGLGTDVLSAWTETPDPLVRPVPPARWPRGVRRVYELPAEGPRGELVSFDCYFEPPEAAVVARMRAAWDVVGDDTPVEVRLRFAPAVAARVAETRWHPSQRMEAAADGSLLWRATVAGILEVRSWILGWGADVEVVGPPELRAWVADQVARAASAYGST